MTHIRFWSRNRISREKKTHWQTSEKSEFKQIETAISPSQFVLRAANANERNFECVYLAASYVTQSPLRLYYKPLTDDRRSDDSVFDLLSRAYIFRKLPFMKWLFLNRLREVNFNLFHLNLLKYLRS